MLPSGVCSDGAATAFSFSKPLIWHSASASQAELMKGWYHMPVQVLNAQGQMREGLAQLIEAKKHRRSAAQKKAITFVSGVGLVAGGIALAASGPGAVVGIPMAVIGAGVVGISAL